MVSRHVRNASRARFVTARDCPYCERHMTQEFTTALWDERQRRRRINAQENRTNTTDFGIISLDFAEFFYQQEVLTSHIGFRPKENILLNVDLKLLKKLRVLTMKNQRSCMENLELETLKIKYQRLLDANKKLREGLSKAEGRFAHIENWHRDNVTPDFDDCQEVGLTPEAYLRDGKNEVRVALSEADKIERGE